MEKDQNTCFRMRRILVGIILCVLGLACVASLALFVFSFFNVKSFNAGWYATSKFKTSGMVVTLVEMGKGGIFIVISDTGYMENDGSYADGLDILHSKLEPFCSIDMDGNHPSYPQLSMNLHWRKSARFFAGTGFATASDLSIMPDRPNTHKIFRGIEILLPIPLLIFSTGILPLLAYFKRRRVLKNGSNRFAVII
jgi:hypothetical protein